MSTTHVLRPRPPLRAFGLAAVLALVGMGFFVAPDLLGWNLVVRAIGVVMLIVGLVVLVLAVLAIRRMRVEIELDDEGYRVTGATGAKTGVWADVVKVTRANHRVILYGRDGGRTTIALPRGGSGDLNALGTDIARRLDAHRGYGTLTGDADLTTDLEPEP